MLLVTLKSIPGKEAEIIGMVVGRYSAISDGFDRAKEKLIEEAKSIEADAVVDIKAMSTPSEVVMLGTAIRFKEGKK